MPNSSFECGRDGWSSIGQVTGWGGDLSSLYGLIQKENAYDGSYCFKIELGEGKTPVTHFAIYPSAKIIQKAPLVGNIGWLRVEKGASYTFSAYMRADRDNVPAKLVLWLGTDQREWAQPDKRYKDVILTKNWKRYSFTLTVEEPDVFISLGPDLTAYPGDCATVWIDAVQLEKGNEATEYIYREDVGIGFDSEKFGDVFSYPEPVNFKLFADNRTSKQAKIRFKVELTDYFDNRIPEIIKELTIPANSLLDNKLEMGISKLGHYRGTISWEINNIKYEKKLKFAYSQQYKFNDSPFAINHAPTTEELCRTLKKIGITWARDWSIDWNQLEPVEGKLSFEKSDYQIDRVLDAGMNIMALLPPFPSAVWASSAPENIDELMGLVNYPKEWHRTGFAPKDTDKLLAFIDKAVNRYKDRINCWEFLNEPIHTIYALPGEHKKIRPPYVPADYVNLLREAYETMKQADPDCTVIGGLQQAPGYRIDEFIQAGGLDYLDVYSIHPYGAFLGPKAAPEGFISKMDTLLSAMDSSKAGRKPIWATECGYYAEDDKPWLPWVPPKGHSSANSQLDSEKICADYLIRFSAIMLAHGVEKIFYHQGAEGQLNNGSMDLENPLLSPLARPTKFYATQSAMANILGPNPK